MATIHISKLDAAKRQLNTAITLFLKKADPVSIHTLTCAAYEILSASAKSKGMTTTLKNSPFIKKEYRKEFYNLLNEPQNFFKHGQKDLKKLLKFNPDVMRYFLLDAVEMYMMITGEKPPEMMAYKAWFLLNNPQFVTEKNRKMLSALSAYNPLSKPEFSDKYLDILYRMKNVSEK